MLTLTNLYSMKGPLHNTPGDCWVVADGKDLLNPLLPEQDVTKPPLSGQHVPEPALPGQHVLKPLAQEQDVMKPPPSEQDVLKPPVSEQDVLKPPVSEQDVMKPPVPEKDVMKPTLQEEDVMKPEPLMLEQDVPKPRIPKVDMLKHLMIPRAMQMRIFWIEDDQSPELLMLQEKKDQFTWDEVAVMVLHMVRCREFTKYDPKMGISVPTRFCLLNIAFFDLDKESEVVLRPPISKIPVSDQWRLEDSVNVISIKVAESDVGYPINVYGTVLARDEYDYRCIYLFSRGRDNPQLITSPEDALILTGPYRAFAVTGNFEVHLKIKSHGAIDKDFNKALIQHNTSHHTREPMTVSVQNCLSTVVMVYSPVTCAVEASLEFNILNGPSNFTGIIGAWTTVSDEVIILYDSEVVGTDANLGIGGSVKLSRHIVAVPMDEGLVLNVYGEDECLEFVVWHELGDDFEHTCMFGPYELQLKVRWTAVERKRRHKMLEHIGQVQVLL